jgi:hypothetical protein
MEMVASEFKVEPAEEEDAEVDGMTERRYESTVEEMDGLVEMGAEVSFIYVLM